MAGSRKCEKKGTWAKTSPKVLQSMQHSFPNIKFCECFTFALLLGFQLQEFLYVDNKEI